VTLNPPTLLLICATTAGWAFSFGLGSQVVSHWLKANGATETVIGLAHSFYYFGLAVGSCAVPVLSRRLGPKLCATFGMLGAGATLAVFPWGESEPYWYLLRFLNGWTGAMSLVPLETIVSRDSLPERRTQNFAYYGVALTLGGAIGIGIGLHLYEPGGLLAFFLGSGASVAAGLLLLAGLQCKRLTDAGNSAITLGWNRNFLSYATAWCQGFLEGGMLAFLSLFLLSQGFSESTAGTLMGVMMVGVILFQVPVSWLADRCGKTPTLLVCYGAVALGLIAIPWITNSLWLALVLFAFGACTGAMYPLGLSMLGDRMPEAGLARAYAWYLAIECIGSQAGAAAMGVARDEWGETAMFVVGLAAVVLVLTAWIGVRLCLRNGSTTALPSSDEQGSRHAA
jgi:MFS family permease